MTTLMNSSDRTTNDPAPTGNRQATDAGASTRSTRGSMNNNPTALLLPITTVTPPLTRRAKRPRIVRATALNSNDDEEEEEEEEDEDSSENSDRESSDMNGTYDYESEQDDSDDESYSDEDEEEDSDFEEDDEDFDEDDDLLPDLMVDYMRAAMHGVEREDDDEDGEECDCPECRYARWRDAHAFGGNNNVYDDNSNDDDIIPCNCVQCRMERQCRQCDDEIEQDESSSEEADENAPSCAICLQAEGRRRILAVLPCCGQSAEATSTMRFCQPCLRKCLMQNHFTNTGPCPRCHALITYTAAPLANDRIRRASTADILEHIARQTNGGAVLVAAAWGLGKQVPAECFSNYQHDAFNEATWVRQLVTWKFLVPSKKRPGRYNLALPQRQVREWVSRHLRPDDEEECFSLVRQNVEITKAVSKQCLFCCLAELAAAWTLIKNSPLKNVGIACRLANRALTLFLVGLVDTRLLPSPLDWNAAAPYFATALNGVVVYLVIKIAYRLLFVAMYVCGFIVMAKLAGLLMLGNPWQQVQQLTQQGVEFLRPYLATDMGRRILHLATGPYGLSCIATLLLAMACEKG